MIKNLFNLAGKTALITGASSGLGWRFAEVLAQAGARVIITARRKSKLEELAAKIADQVGDGKAMLLVMDVANQVSVHKVISQLTKRGEKIDILVNNAGIAKATPIFEPKEYNEFEEIFQTNVIGLWYVTKAVANHMKAQNIQGSIINIASVNGENRVSEEWGSYCASKAAVIQLTKALVGELAKHKIRINCIMPGWFNTPMVDAHEAKIMKKLIPLGFVAEPQDLDGAILFLASNQASRYMTGSSITIDGGVSWGGS